MQTIQAKVNPRLLTKANRLFTGTVTGRIIEILQNARRAGATKVVIHNHDGVVSVHDNGDGVNDFSTLLDMGGSGWDGLDASEDPAGVGIFYLAPRRVTIRSRGNVAVIDRDGWNGLPVDVTTDPQPCTGTLFEFEDEPWSKGTVEPYAVFSGMDVVVDGEPCAREDFVRETASHHAALGCRIEVRDAADLNSWHRSFRCVGYQAAGVLANFYGQVVAFYCDGIGERDLHVLVDLTGDPTNIRLMLPARTQLIENDAMAQLKDAIQMEAYRYILRRGHYTLPYEQYLDAARRGINLPEATPTYAVGLLSRGDLPEAVEVAMPDGLELERCYRFADDSKNAEIDEANAHIFAALGKCDEPFVPVTIHHRYLGYPNVRRQHRASPIGTRC